MKQEKGETNVRVVKEPVFREKPAGPGDDHKKMQILRENFYAAGKCPALAGLLYGMQSEVQAEGNSYRKVQKMREDIHIPVRRPALAAVLSGVPGKAETEMKTVKPAGARTCQPVSTSMPRAASSAVTGASICRSVTTVFTRSFRLRGTVPCLENFSDSVRTMTRSA